MADFDIVTDSLQTSLLERIEQIENDTEIKSYIKLSPLEFNFNNSHFIFINKSSCIFINSVGSCNLFNLLTSLIKDFFLFAIKST